LGAGTGVVGIMAAYCGATSYVTDLESLVPLIQYNIDQNKKILNGSAAARALCWGCQRSDLSDDFIAPDFLILANCIYYESSLDVLLDIVVAITCHGTAPTVILACYEERTKEICGLVSR
jgi:predicted nicotinamide N-methyase